VRIVTKKEAPFFQIEILKSFPSKIKSYVTVSQVQVINESPAEFPSVLLCDSNPFTTLESQLFLDQIMKNITDIKQERFGLKSGLYLHELGFSNYYFQNSKSKRECLSWDAFQYATTFTFDTNFTDSQRKSLGWDLSKVLIKCKFNGINCDINKDFEWYFSFQYGNCYRFNSIRRKNQVKKIKDQF